MPSTSSAKSTLVPSRGRVGRTRSSRKSFQVWRSAATCRFSRIVRSSNSSNDCHVRASPSRDRDGGPARRSMSSPGEVDAPAGRHEAGDAVDEGGLAGAVRADQSDELPGSHLEVDAVDGPQATERHAHLGRASSRVMTRAPPRRWRDAARLDRRRPVVGRADVGFGDEPLRRQPEPAGDALRVEDRREDQAEPPRIGANSPGIPKTESSIVNMTPPGTRNPRPRRRTRPRSRRDRRTRRTSTTGGRRSTPG